MRSGSVIVVILVLVTGALDASAGHGKPPAGEERSDLQTFETVVAPFFKAKCGRCHSARRQEGDLRLDRIDGDLVGGKDGQRWKEVYDRLNRGEMPPKAEPALRAKDIEPVTTWIAGEMRKADRVAHGSGGRAVLRRLNRVEYSNTLRDLLHVRFLFADGPMDLLPPDGTAGGFDKVGSALMIDPSLLSQYVAVSQRVADAAIVTAARPTERWRRRFEYEDTARSPSLAYECAGPQIVCQRTDLALMGELARTWVELHFDRAAERPIPANGEYTIRVRMGASVGARGEPLKVQLEWPPGTILAAWTLTRNDETPRVFEVRFPASTAGKTREGPQVHLINGTNFYIFNELFGTFRDEAERASAAGDLVKVRKLWALAKAEGAATPDRPNPAIYDRDKLPRLLLDWIEIEGPLIDQWPPASHREVFFEGPTAKQDLAYARRIFEHLLPRAYRRPVKPAEVDAVVLRVERELQAHEAFEEAVKVGLEYVLSSPKFLYLVEPEKGEDLRPLGDFELASRLAYFLWSSMPDDELFRLAGEGRLHVPATLDAQVQRMLRDEKSAALVDGFGAEWLQASKFAGISPNRQIYKDWDDELDAAVKREPLAFFQEILRGDLSALNFLDSDFGMLNGRLARHYGVAGVEGPAFRRVKLPATAHRGGLITQAGILTIGSDGTRTLPVRRAAWILQTLFNRPPPPPPPNVREVESNVVGKRLTVRDRLLQHQKLPACASCHQKIDAYGLALESYDAVGAWRTLQNGEDFGPYGDRAPAIDASGTLPDGRAFKTTAQFRSLLFGDQDRFCRAFTEKMLTYALGRTIGPADTETVDSVVAPFKDGQFRISALVKAIVKSKAFQTR